MSGVAGQPAQSILVEDLHHVQVGQGDQPLLAQLGERTADRFHGQAQMVGDVTTPHRQRHPQAVAAKPGFACGQAQQEIGHLLRRLQPGQRQRGVLRRIQFLAGTLQQLALQVREAAAQRFHLRQRDAAHAAVGDGFDIVAMVVAATQAQIIARQHESTDLAAAIGQSAHQAQRPGGQCIDMLAFFAGAGQRTAQGDLLRMGDLFQRLHFIGRQRRAHRKVADRAMQAVQRAAGRRGGIGGGGRSAGRPGHVAGAYHGRGGLYDTSCGLAAPYRRLSAAGR